MLVSCGDIEGAAPPLWNRGTGAAKYTAVYETKAQERRGGTAAVTLQDSVWSLDWTVLVPHLSGLQDRVWVCFPRCLGLDRVH